MWENGYMPLKVEIKLENFEKVEKKSNTPKDWPCRHCDAVYPSIRKLREHRKIHYINREEQLKYNRNVVEEIPHTYKFDALQDLYICNTCSAEFQMKEEIEEHMENHDTVFTCGECQEKFKKPYAYAIHMFGHSSDDLFRCPQCDHSTPDRRCLHSHIKYVHKKRFTFSCTICGKGYNDTTLLKEHEVGHSGARPYVCVVCEKDFVHSSYLTYHQVRNHRVIIEGAILPNQCHFCNKVFAKLTTLENHVREKHSAFGSKKKHLCETCGKEFNNTSHLKVHVRIHTGEKPYSCNDCGKRFTKKNHLTTHERVHSGVKPYKCEYCGKTFSQTTGLKVHVRGHTGERPFVCEKCGAAFTSTNALKGHVKNCLQTF